MADGLKVLLENNIIHRDLKPANLLLDRKSTLSDVGTLKIADFGLAREILSGELAQTQLGSPNYMAPEIMDGKTYDSRADLFSVGVILYEMLYGRLPWIARSMYELRNMIHSVKPQFPETVDLAAIHLMKNLLQFDPQHRLNFEAFYSHPYLAQDPVLNSSDDLSLGAFQDNLFDFTYLEDSNELIDRIEEKAKCAFYIAEAAHYMGNSLHGFSLFVKSMKLLLETIHTIPKPYSPRIAAVVTWMKSRYVAFEKKTDAFKKQAMLDYICPEKTLFEYAIRIGTEAANDELMIQDTNRVIIYTRSKAIIDYLLERGKDVEMLTMYSQLFGARIKHLKSL
jgi:serine/threonine protein kinase